MFLKVDLAGPHNRDLLKISDISELFLIEPLAVVKSFSLPLAFSTCCMMGCQNQKEPQAGRFTDH